MEQILSVAAVIFFAVSSFAVIESHAVVPHVDHAAAPIKIVPLAPIPVIAVEAMVVGEIVKDAAVVEAPTVDAALAEPASETPAERAAIVADELVGAAPLVSPAVESAASVPTGAASAPFNPMRLLPELGGTGVVPGLLLRRLKGLAGSHRRVSRTAAPYVPAPDPLFQYRHMMKGLLLPQDPEERWAWIRNMRDEHAIIRVTYMYVGNKVTFEGKIVEISEHGPIRTFRLDVLSDKIRPDELISAARVSML